MAKRKHEHYIKKFTPFGKFIYFSKSATFYYNGDGLNFYWNWWNPMSWIIGMVVAIITILCYGIIETWNDRDELGFGLNPWFKTHPDRYEQFYWKENTND